MGSPSEHPRAGVRALTIRIGHPRYGWRTALFLRLTGDGRFRREVEALTDAVACGARDRIVRGGSPSSLESATRRYMATRTATAFRLAYATLYAGDHGTPEKKSAWALFGRSSVALFVFAQRIGDGLLGVTALAPLPTPPHTLLHQAPAGILPGARCRPASWVPRGTPCLPGCTQRGRGPGQTHRSRMNSSRRRQVGEAAKGVRDPDRVTPFDARRDWRSTVGALRRGGLARGRCDLTS